MHDIILDTTPDVVSEFLSTLSDANASTYLDENLAPVLLTIDGAQGLERFASVVGVDPRDLWPNAAAIFLMLCAGVVLFSTAALAVSAVFAQRGKTPPGVQPTRRVPSHGALDDMTGGHASYLKEEEDDFALKQSNNPWIQSSSPDGINWDWHFRMFCGNLLRVTLLFQLPIVIFSSFQIALLRPRTDTFPASKVSVALAVLLLLFVTLFPFWALWRVHVNSVRDTAGKVPPLLSYGTLYNLFGDRSYQFMLVRLVGVTIVGIFVGALQSHPLVQVIIILVVEIVETLTTVSFRLISSLANCAHGASLGFVAALRRKRSYGSIDLPLLRYTCGHSRSPFGHDARRRHWSTYYQLDRICHNGPACHCLRHLFPYPPRQDHRTGRPGSWSRAVR